MGSLLFSVCLCSLLTLCTSQDKDPTFPNIDSIIENGVIAEVEIKTRPENETVIVKEYYYKSDDKTRLDILQNGKRTMAFFYPKDDLIAIIKDNACKVSKAGESDFVSSPLFTGWLYSPKDSDSVFLGPSSLLRRAAEFPPIYSGDEETVRGIKCQKYTHTDPDNDDIEIDYYFTGESWTTPINRTKIRIPIKVELFGNGKPTEQSKDEMFVQSVDFTFFQPYVEKTRLFEPPAGFGCKGLINREGPELPPLSKQFTLVGEEYDPKEKLIFSVNTFRVWYSYLDRLVRIDSFTKNKAMSSVLDFNTGIMYVTNEGKTCNAEPISDENFESFHGFVGDIAKPNEVFRLSDTFYYLDKTYIRGINCDVWESVKENVTIDTTTYNRVVYTHYFTSHLWEIETEGVQDEQVPVRLEMNMYTKDIGKPAMQKAVNFFAFNKHPVQDYSIYSIENCLGASSDKSYFLVVFSASIAHVKLALKNAALVQEEIKQELLNIAGISVLRLPFVRVDYEPETITVTGLILERVSILKQFQKLEDVINPGDQQINKGKVEDDSACADACVSDDGCTGFHVCAGQCYISLITWGESWGKELNVKNCVLYLRNERGTNSKDVSLADALKNLGDAVESKTLVILLKKGDDEILLKPEYFIKNLSPFISGDHYSDMYELILSKKALESSADSETTRSGGKVNNPSECYKKCKDEKNIVCSSFSFCGNSFVCQLSSLLFIKGKDMKDEVIDDSSCSVYSLSYLQMFEEYKGQIPVIPADKQINKVESEKDCAKNCRSETTFICRGFEYCNSRQSCNLHKKHVLDMEKGLSTVTTSCSHYALKYSADYMNLGRVIIKDDNAKVFKSLSLEECAKMCSEKSEYNCLTFDFCPSDEAVKRSCTLNMLKLDSKGVETEDSDSCQHYARRDIVDDWAQPRTNIKSGSGGYSSSGFAGMIIGVLIFGIIVGIAGFLGYSYFKSRKPADGISVKFMKHENA